MSITTHTNWKFGSYEADRLYFIRTAENPNGRLDAHFEGTSIAIGYGYDLIQHYTTVETDLAEIGITLTTTQMNLLSEARTANATRTLRDRSRVVPRSDSACVFTKRLFA